MPWCGRRQDRQNWTDDQHQEGLETTVVVDRVNHQERVGVTLELKQY